MALATWASILLGEVQAQQELQMIPTTQRTRPPSAKTSLFQKGLHLVAKAFAGTFCLRLIGLELGDWLAPGWADQITSLTFRAFLFSAHPARFRSDPSPS